jgi:hypothetical protein
MTEDRTGAVFDQNSGSAAFDLMKKKSGSAAVKSKIGQPIKDNGITRRDPVDPFGDNKFGRFDLKTFGDGRLQRGKVSIRPWRGRTITVGDCSKVGQIENGAVRIRGRVHREGLCAGWWRRRLRII